MSPSSINLYEYVRNDPINGWDPNGFGFTDDLKTFGKSVLQSFQDASDGFQDALWTFSSADNPAEGALEVIGNALASLRSSVTAIGNTAANPGEMPNLLLEASTPEGSGRLVGNIVIASVTPTKSNLLNNNSINIVRRFDSKKNIKNAKKKGIEYDPEKGTGISTTTVTINPVNPDKIKELTGARSAEAYMDITIEGKRYIVKRTKSGKLEIVLQEGVLPSDIVDTGKVAKSKKSENYEQ